MSARVLATALLLASGCRDILGIDTAIVGPIDSSDKDPGDAPPIDGFPADALKVPPVDAPPPGQIAAVQGNYSDPQSANMVTVPFSLAETAGNLNVVVIGWLGAGVGVQTIADTEGNDYAAVAPPTANGNVQLAIYYAAVAASGPNTVGIVFDKAASFPDVRIAEYRGLSQLGPLEAQTVATGTGTICDSGTITTTRTDELLVGANMTTNALVIGGLGVDFNERVLSQPDKDVLSDRVVGAVGTFHATATLDVSNGWIMQIVAFSGAAATN